VSEPREPTVSVVVPNYNHARFLPKRIDSILKQTFQDFELILLDDCSTDDSRSILSSYASDPRVRIEFNEVNSASSFKQWSKGIRIARGKYIWIAESDDYADGRLLERLVAVLDNDPAVAFAYCRSWVVDEDDELHGFEDSSHKHLDPHRWEMDFCADGREECRHYFIYNNPAANASSVVFRKAACELVGGVDDAMRTSGDWKLLAAMALTGRVAYLSEPLNYYRFHDATVRNRMSGALIVTERLQVVRWILDRVTPTKAALEKACMDASDRWVPEVMSIHVPLGLKLKVLKSAAAIDPHPIRRALRPALLTVQRKFLRHWRSVGSIITEPRT
jgi:glycosyltransferase involved in cell wall biosynthesis